MSNDDDARPDDPEVEKGLVEESDELDVDEGSDIEADDDPVVEPVEATDPPSDDSEPDDPDPDDPEVEEDDSAESLAALGTPPEDETTPPEDEKPRRRRWLWVAFGVVGVLAVLYAVGFVLTGLRMPANATIGGVDVSGKSPSDAKAAVDRALTPHVDDPVTLEHQGRRFVVDPADAGLRFDLDRSIEEAGGQHSLDPRDMVGLFFGTHESAPALDVDDERLDNVVSGIAATVDQEVVEPLITFVKTEPKARQPVPGLVAVKAETADAIKGAYLVERDPVPVPTEVVEPSVDEEGLAEAMRTIARPAVSAPVVINVGDKKVDLPVTAYAPALTIGVEGSRMAPQIDPEKLAKPLTDRTTGIGKKAVDATVRIKDGKPVVVPGKPGIGLQPQEMAEKLEPVLTKTGAERSVTISAKVVEPDFTTEEAKALGIRERISSFSTYFPYAEYRNVNQGRAAELIDGTILKPGETFSFNNTVGERTVANGFVTGTVINGGVFREELGGGVSQVATTTYNAAFFGGMEDVEHHPHAFYIDRYPVGREATVYFGSLDLRFRNPTKYGVLIRAYVNRSTPSSRGEMHVELWSTKVWDEIKAGLSERRNGRAPGTRYDPTNRCVPQSPIAGFDIDVYRSFVRDGRVVKRESDTAVYQAADHVICGKNPNDD